ncbi:hypothetical protein [Deinococcus sp. UYEF24]
MRKITPQQLAAVQAAHADGLLDSAIAERAGISLSTVKRVRSTLGLETHCQTTLRGRLGEEVTARRAAQLGLTVQWRVRDNDKYDLIVAGRRVDAKASMQLSDGTWKFRLPEHRRSFHHRYTYRKDYAHDCDVIVLVCLYPDGREPEMYLLDSTDLPGTVRIYPGVTYVAEYEAWGCLTSPQPSEIAA